MYGNWSFQIEVFVYLQSVRIWKKKCTNIKYFISWSVNFIYSRPKINIYLVILNLYKKMHLYFVQLFFNFVNREFTLKESFWFALTSFTPQGGGEAPKALSGRTLVAAYWLFVVLMLATFTANLAAFLTVERMKVTEVYLQLFSVQ